jgi:acetylornithine deacetylase/succinyl-diaminopimelate desuccinylase-like protein
VPFRLSIRALAVAALAFASLAARSPAQAAAGRSSAASAPLAAHQQLARDVFRELIEINTTDTSTRAAEAMAARFRAAGFPAADVQLVGPVPHKQNLVVRYRGSGARRPILLLAHLDVVAALRDDWSMDPFTFTERDGYYYGRGTTDDKAMAAIFVANLLRYKREGYVPDRDLILALTADEEDGAHNGVEWLLANRRDLVDAAYALNEGGGGSLRGGKPIRPWVEATE